MIPSTRTVNLPDPEKPGSACPFDAGVLTYLPPVGYANAFRPFPSVRELWGFPQLNVPLSDIRVLLLAEN